MPTFIAENASLIGDIALGHGSSVWYGAVIRNDDKKITIGDYTNIQDNCTLHISRWDDLYIGSYVTVGHNAIVHGCRVEDNCLIGMGSIIMNRAHIGKNCIIGAGAVVTEGKEIPEGSLVLGVPAKVIRTLTDEEIKSIRESAIHYNKLAEEYAASV